MFAGFTNYLSNAIQGSELQRQQKLIEEQRKGSATISYEMEDFMFDSIKRERAFFQGINVTAGEEMDKGEMYSFEDLADILPLKPKGDMAEMDFKKLMKST